ncbi:hypothetical protein [Micromonospora mirobrigensis]|uniref:Uncharacterized protein n=1 Tax=Micromonospora mirobrigensis TaxID=262898 RepID=A0A1C4XM23_9ACTN|nr:hypothetical protein [Micromonospora mirobrigensis]SCF09545.1 hypothetical protein GA0070564_103198 [Micromonospora mirobrigensis]
MTDLDQDILRTLRDHAEGPVDTDRLVARSVAGGRRRRRRRHALIGGGLALVALLGGVAVGPGLPGVGRPFTAAGPAAPAGAVPPLVRSAPGAADAPQTLGTDAQLLHFGVDTAKARYLGWASGDGGTESVRLDVGDGRPVTVELARSPRPLRESTPQGVPWDVAELAGDAGFDGRTIRLTVDGLPIQVRQWQPAPGVYARATVSADRDTGLTVAAQALRLDEARRCAAPVRLRTVPGGASIRCQVDADSYPRLLTARFTIVGRKVGTDMTVSYVYAIEAADASAQGNTTIDGRPAILYEQGQMKRMELLGFPKAHLTVDFGWPSRGFDDRDAAAVLSGAEVADPTRPDTWD